MLRRSSLASIHNRLFCMKRTDILLEIGIHFISTLPLEGNEHDAWDEIDGLVSLN